MKRAPILLAVALLAGLMPAGAHSTDTTLSSVADQIRWHGDPVTGNTGLAPIPEQCVVAECDEFAFTVDLPASTWSTPGGVQVSIRWHGESNDLDLYVFDASDALVAKSEGTYSTGESTIVVEAPNGAYRALVVPTAADGVEYEGSIEVEFAPAASPARDLLPDLVSLPARNLRYQTSAYLFELPVPSMPGGCYPEESVEQGARRCLRFDQIIANFGDGAFEVRYRLDSIGTDQKLVQRIYRSDGTYTERFVAKYVFHAAHAHFHFEQFAQSHLYAADEHGNKLSAAPVRSGRKNGFCMIDVEPSKFGERGDAPRTYTPEGCFVPEDLDPEAGRVAAISGISVGWADVYNWFLADQFIEVTGLADGYYILENVADAEHKVAELDDTNNAAQTLIRLCGDTAEIVGVDRNC